MTEQTATETTAKAPKKAPEITTVTMKDGRIVEFVGNKSMLKSDIVLNGLPAVRFDFKNGETREVAIDIGGLHEKLAQHGLKQKIGDEAAGYKDLDEAIMAIDDVIQRLTDGNFNAVREANAFAGQSILVKALAEVFKKDPVAIKTWLSSKDNAQKKALRNDPNVAPVTQRLEAEKAKKEGSAAKVDTAALLGELSAA